ncbi:MAG TPA: lysophospholipid acyltransferase family protein, partial [Parasegetibacter sp.]
IYRYATVTVNRSNPEARAASVRRLRNELKRGISIFLFPEGTFNTSEKLLKDFYDGAFKLAIEMQLPIQPLLFVDTKRRMHYKSLLCLNPGISRSVFLDVVETNGLTPADLPQLKELVFKKMEKGLEAFL